jgi:hypothetical protein
MQYRKTLLSLIAVAALAACSGGDTKTDQTAAAPVAPNVVTFTALDYMFEGPAEIPAGPTTIKLHSTGAQIHHLVMVKLGEGKTVDSLTKALANPGPPPAWATFTGGPNAPAPGGTSNVTLNLEPGNYAMICFVDIPEHKPHFTRGMFRALTVTPSAAPTNATLPAPTHTVTATEYAFALDKDLVAGKNIIKVVNAGVEPHEIEIIRLEPGKTLEDFGKWMASMQGPPPAVPVGGISPFNKGADVQFEADLVAGKYVMLCFAMAPDGKMHSDKGMIKEFEIH